MIPEDIKAISNFYEWVPEFIPRWEQYLKNEIIEPEDEEYLSLYDFGQEFSEYIVEVFRNGNHNLLKKCFLAIENLCSDSDEYLSNTGHVGFVEALLILRSHKKIELDAFDEWMGEKSKIFWYQMHEYFTKDK